MCLCRIDQRLEPNQKIRPAYKVFSRNDSHALTGYWMYGRAYGVYQTNTWLSAKPGSVRIDDPPPDCSKRAEFYSLPPQNRPKYDAGFHAFEKLEDAQKYTTCGEIREVKLRDVRIVGKGYLNTIQPGDESDGAVYVAQELFITDTVLRG